MLLDNKDISSHTFHIYCPIWMKFGAGDVQINIHGFRENPLKEDRVFRTQVNEIAIKIVI
jgi:hypothetical protein